MSGLFGHLLPLTRADSDEFHYSVSIEQVQFSNVPSTCSAALSVSCTNLTISSITVNDSSCSGEAIIWFNKASVEFTGSNRFLCNKGTCMSSTHGKVVFSTDYTLFSDNVADRYSGSTPIIVNSTVHTQKERHKSQWLIFQNNTGKHCGGIMARENSKLIIGDGTNLQFINNSGFDGGALSLYMIILY